MTHIQHTNHTLQSKTETRKHNLQETVQRFNIKQVNTLE